MSKRLYFYLVDYFSTNPERYNIIHIVLLFGLPYSKVLNRLHFSKGERILDLGCGPSQILEKLPNDIEYVGVDQNEKHLMYAAKKYKGRNCTFKNSRIQDLELNGHNAFQKVFMLGFLHHLDDSTAKELLRFAKVLCKGQLVTFDPVFTRLHFFANLLGRLDQGRFVRKRNQYEQIVSENFTIKESFYLPSPSRLHLFLVTISEPKF